MIQPDFLHIQNNLQIERISFIQAPTLGNPHTQTLWQSLFGRGIETPVHEQRWELPDGDFLDLVWSGGQAPPPACDDQ